MRQETVVSEGAVWEQHFCISKRPGRASKTHTYIICLIFSIAIYVPFVGNIYFLFSLTSLNNIIEKK